MRSFGHIQTLDGIRGIAIIMVLWAHFVPIEGAAVSYYIAKLGDIVGAGYFGVDLFFVLSGFLITRTLIASAQRREEGLIRNFLVKRVFRIFPVYFLSLFFVAAVVGQTGYDVFSSLLYVSNFYFVFDSQGGPIRHTWSLAVEEQFYLIWPWLFVLLSTQYVRVIVFPLAPIIAIFSALLALYLLGPETGAQFIYRSTTCRMLSLSLGASIAFVEFDQQARKSKRLAVVVGLGAAFVLLCAYFMSVKGSQFFPPVAKMLGFSGLSYSIVLYFVGLGGANTRLTRIASMEPLVYLGKISYGVYLYHAILLYLFGVSKYQVEKMGLGIWFGVLGLSIGVAALSFKYFETPLIRCRERYLVKEYSTVGAGVV